MAQYKIRKDDYKKIRKAALRRSIPVLVIAAGTGIYVSFSYTAQIGGDTNVLPFLIPIFALVIGLGVYRGLKRQQVLFDSYTLTMTDNMITREQFNTPVITMYFNEIEKISRCNNGNLLIKGKNATGLICIPSQVENYEELLAALESVRPVETNRNPGLLEKYPALIAMVIGVLIVAVYLFNNKIIVGIAGVLLLLIMTRSIVKVQASKNVDNRTKRSMWWIVIVMLAVIGIMFIKLTGL